MSAAATATRPVTQHQVNLALFHTADTSEQFSRALRALMPLPIPADRRAGLQLHLTHLAAQIAAMLARPDLAEPTQPDNATDQ